MTTTTMIKTVRGMRMMMRTEEVLMMTKVKVTQMMEIIIIRKMVRRRMPKTMAMTVMMKMLINNVEVTSQVTTIIDRVLEVLRAA